MKRIIGLLKWYEWTLLIIFSPLILPSAALGYAMTAALKLLTKLEDE